jgi:hypothetical protein
MSYLFVPLLCLSHHPSVVLHTTPYTSPFRFIPYLGSVPSQCWPFLLLTTAVVTNCDLQPFLCVPWLSRVALFLLVPFYTAVYLPLLSSSSFRLPTLLVSSDSLSDKLRITTSQIVLVLLHFLYFACGHPYFASSVCIPTCHWTPHVLVPYLLF